MKKAFWFALMATVFVASLAVVQPAFSETAVTIASIAESGIAADVNEAGQIAGVMYVEGEGDHAFLWTVQDGLRDIGPGYAFTINDLGEIVGFTYDINVPNQTHAFYWSESTGMQDIHSHDAPTTWAFDINNQGQVVGWYSYGCPGGWCIIPPCDGVFLWTKETGMVDLTEQTGLPITCAFDINENGQIVGNSDNGPYVWSKESGIQYITDNPNDQAYSINDAGQVTGYTSNGGVFVWSANSGMTYLNIDQEGYVFINELGQITGSIGITEGETWHSHAYIWIPDMSLLVLPHLSEIEFPASYGARSNNNGQIVGQSNGHAVLWTIELPPPTPQKQIALIGIKVNALANSGVLDKGEGTALISKLDAATFQVNKGNNKAARNILGAFINTVEAFVNSERLTTVQAQPLITAANAAINDLP